MKTKNWLWLGLLGLGGVAVVLATKSKPAIPLVPSISVNIFVNDIDITVDNVAHIGDKIKYVWKSENYPIGAYTNIDVLVNTVPLGKNIVEASGEQDGILPGFIVPAVMEITLELYDSANNLLAKTVTNKILVL